MYINIVITHKKSSIDIVLIGLFITELKITV